LTRINTHKLSAILLSHILIVNIKWGKEKYKDIEVDLEGTGSDLKVLVYSLTAVATERQKIIIKGKTLQVQPRTDQIGHG